MKCIVCGRELKKPTLTGAGRVCAQKLKFSNSDKSKLTAELIGNYGDQRSYLVFSKPREIVKVKIESDDARFAFCSCNQLERCEHIAVVAEKDRQDFAQGNN